MNKKFFRPRRIRLWRTIFNPEYSGQSPVFIRNCFEKGFARSLTGNKKGNILMITLLILTSILAITLGAAALVAQGIKLHRTQKWSTVAFFAAESGAERILYEDRKGGFDFLRADGSVCQPGDYISLNPDDCGGSDICCVASFTETELSEDGPRFNIIYNEEYPEIILKSTGAYQETRRRIELRYE
jgi:hypothetical protein